MSEELQKPPVIDIEALLQPISEENPSGEYLRYSGVYDQIAEARRADENLNQGAWQTELKVADFRQVVSLATNALANQSKDLQISAWLSEAIVKIHGFAGLRDSLKLVAGLQEKFWDTLHPEIDEGDMEGRANAISWLDAQASFAAKETPITGGLGYSFFNWEDSKRFEIPDNLDTLDSADAQRFRDLQAQAERENRVTGELWRREKLLTKRAFCEETNFIIEECWTEFNELNRIIEEKFDRNQMPGLTNLKKALEDIHLQVKKLLEEKRLEEPNESDNAVETEVAADGETVIVAAAGGVAVAAGAIQNRKDALKRLADIADFFQKTEPHSPVSYLVQRAVKWGNMPLDGWLQDVIKDESVLFQLRQTLGLNTGGSENSEY
ncbi:MAG TPA: type VI secretion system protein TssA [Pyrinomonadaceae bacterium]|nr:type VI secretion system protein TssA [Pyrinomonadaceae bacterium]